MKVVDTQLVVCNIGHPSQELFQIKDRVQNFYMLGSMGLASSIGLGLALAQPNHVIVIDGDGSVLMNLGSLTTIGYHHPKNLTVIVIDNESYGSTGFQPTFTRYATNLEAIAKGCGIKNTTTITKEAKIQEMVAMALKANELWFLLVKTEEGKPQTQPIPFSASEIKERFMKNTLNLQIRK